MTNDKLIEVLTRLEDLKLMWGVEGVSECISQAIKDKIAKYQEAVYAYRRDQESNSADPADMPKDLQMTLGTEQILQCLSELFALSDIGETLTSVMCKLD